MVPNHLAIIMDGNRRWARGHALDIAIGHNEGAQTLKKICKAVSNQAINYLTVFAFSSENWSRSTKEIDALMGLMRRFLMQEVDELVTQNVRLRIIGDRSVFDDEMQKLFSMVEQKTRNNSGLVLTIAVNYGGRQDIAQAVVALANQLSKGFDVHEERAVTAVKSHLMTQDLPDVDLLIRTGGEKRISNFLLWDISYAELYFSDKLWPDFSETDLKSALDDYGTRKRRFGGDSALRTVG
ncbi:MAG: polyprenyl diphosphate synthase [Pseudomonadota bacterium]|nr:polyprenyl diphosphate synthase [Pseudomonadota bacterium]